MEMAETEARKGTILLGSSPPNDRALSNHRQCSQLFTRENVIISVQNCHLFLEVVVVTRQGFLVLESILGYRAQGHVSTIRGASDRKAKVHARSVLMTDIHAGGQHPVVLLEQGDRRRGSVNHLGNLSPEAPRGLIRLPSLIYRPPSSPPSFPTPSLVPPPKYVRLIRHLPLTSLTCSCL